MAVRKICRQKGCRASPRCQHPWYFDVMHNRKRWRMPVDDFAIARGAIEPITSKETAMKLWGPKFLAEIVAGRDPRVPPNVPKVAVGVTVAEFIDRYFSDYIEAEGLRDASTIKSRLKAIKVVLAHQRARRQERLLLLQTDATIALRLHKQVGPAMHDRLIGAIDTCCRRGEMLRIQNRHVDWERHQIAIPGRHAKDAENRRIPFDPHGRLAPVLKRRAELGPSARRELQHSVGVAASAREPSFTLIVTPNRWNGVVDRYGGS